MKGGSNSRSAVLPQQFSVRKNKAHSCWLSNASPSPCPPRQLSRDQQTERLSFFDGMAAKTETKACNACVAAKRKCARQVPQCHRCWTRGVDCEYRPTKPTSFVLCEQDDWFQIPPVDQSTPLPMVCSSQPTTLAPAYRDLMLHAGFPAPEQFDDALSIKPHFWQPTTYEMWSIEPIPPQDFNSVTASSLKHYVKIIHEWYAQWIREGSNQFIHPQLYRFRFPTSIQHAYTALTAYLHKTTANESMVFQIILDRVDRLVKQDCVAYSSGLDPLEHLARVQALSVYQAICLHDGDIRLRQVGEGNIPVMYNWLCQMVDKASQSPCLGWSIVWSMTDQTANIFDVAICYNLPWYSWILAESCRRTWMVASSIQNIFKMCQTNSALPCSGAMAFTASPGIWEASSATAWEEQMSAGNIGLVQMAKAQNVLEKVQMWNINDFARAFMEAAYGEDTVRRYARLTRA